MKLSISVFLLLLLMLPVAAQSDLDRMIETEQAFATMASDKGTKSANKRVDPMRSQTGMTRDAILESFAASFARRYRTTVSDYTDAELAEAQRLVDEKFATPGWTHRVP